MKTKTSSEMSRMSQTEVKAYWDAREASLLNASLSLAGLKSLVCGLVAFLLAAAIDWNQTHSPLARLPLSKNRPTNPSEPDSNL